jgi:hypothetical protein
MSEGKPVEIRVELPEPHSQKQKLIMAAFTMPFIEKIYVACGSKYGKSLSASANLSNAAMRKRGKKWRWIAPIYEQSKVGMDYFRKILPPSPHTHFRDGDMRIELPYIDSQIQFWHCKNPMSLEGPGIDGNIFDEAAKCPYEAVAAAQTTVTFTRGPQGYFSTPLGKNWFYKECMEAKEHMAWCTKNGKLPKRIFLTAPTHHNPKIDKRIIREAKRALPDRLFRQYYMAEFMDDGSVFIGFRDCVRGPLIEVSGGIQRWVDPTAKQHTAFIGVDWAKKNDFTVITALAIVDGKPKCLGFMRFQGLTYPAAVKELYSFSKEFKTIANIRHDKTGVGEAIDDMLAGTGLPYEGVVFTNLSKSAMVNELIMGFQRADIILPYWQEMVGELESYSVEVNDLGTPRYSAPGNLHDDIVSSLMLAYAAAKEYSAEFKLSFLEDLPNTKMSVDSYYNDLMDEG